MPTHIESHFVSAGSTSSFCTFRVHQLHFGIEVQLVQEVLRCQRTTRVPGAQEVVRGLMNLRGQIVTALDMRRRLQLQTDDNPPPSMNVVVRSPEGPISLLVDEIGDVVQVDSSKFEFPPENLKGEHRELVTGAYKLDKHLLLVLDTDRLIRHATCTAKS